MEFGKIEPGEIDQIDFTLPPGQGRNHSAVGEEQTS